MDEPSMTNEYNTFAYWAPGSSKNIDNSDINDEDIDSNISESESAEGSPCFLDSEEYSIDEDDLDFDIINESMHDFCCLQDMTAGETNKDINTDKMSSDIRFHYHTILGRFRRLKIAQSNKRQQHGKKSVNSKSWSNENECKEMDIQVEYNSWDPYLERVVYILKDCKFEKLINGQETVHWADDAYSRCPQKY
ncbi:41468_t:CDS:2 [Gigaspora margarita]|uniref:41468_t:CDS:1 n=1 Tax=Gigaspora margarita TaxID=4874 RepID=A0ABN7UU60_GIGMA|nr:41468_t:CDS:2 [Gigaspora margarita]